MLPPEIGYLERKKRCWRLYGWGAPFRISTVESLWKHATFPAPPGVQVGGPRRLPRFKLRLVPKPHQFLLCHVEIVIFVVVIAAVGIWMALLPCVSDVKFEVSVKFHVDMQSRLFLHECEHLDYQVFNVLSRFCRSRMLTCQRSEHEYCTLLRQSSSKPLLAALNSRRSSDLALVLWAAAVASAPSNAPI